RARVGSSAVTRLPMKGRSSNVTIGMPWFLHRVSHENATTVRRKARMRRPWAGEKQADAIARRVECARDNIPRIIPNGRLMQGIWDCRDAGCLAPDQRKTEIAALAPRLLRYPRVGWL